MVQFAESAYRDCGHCGYAHVAMREEWSARRLYDIDGQSHSAAAYACPRCAGITVVTLDIVTHPASSKSDGSISPTAEVIELDVQPAASALGSRVDHLPEDVERYFFDAQRALRADLPDSAAVQLRKTLEAAAAHKGISERTLVNSIRKLVEEGYVTLDFKDVMTHIRKLGNSGAHHTDVVLTRPEVERSVRFTTQVLRNLFEVPGELRELEQEALASEMAPDAQ